MAEEWVERVESWLADTEQELARFENAVAKHGLRVFKRDADGDRPGAEAPSDHHRGLPQAVGEEALNL